jgi:hypothetical protein
MIRHENVPLCFLQQAVADSHTQSDTGESSAANEAQQAGNVKLGVVLQTLLARTNSDEEAIVPLLLARGVIQQVQTFEVEVQTLDGDTFGVKLDAEENQVSALQEGIQRHRGTEVQRQQLFRVAAGGEASNITDATPLGSETSLHQSCSVMLCVDVEPDQTWTRWGSSISISDEQACQTGNVRSLVSATGTVNSCEKVVSVCLLFIVCSHF